MEFQLSTHDRLAPTTAFLPQRFAAGSTTANPRFTGIARHAFRQADTAVKPPKRTNERFLHWYRNIALLSKHGPLEK
eukprot:4654276-Amphidinium_carterae.1